MRATGIVRRIDDLGRIVIQKDIRETLKLRAGDPMEFFVSKSADGSTFLCLQKVGEKTKTEQDAVKEFTELLSVSYLTEMEKDLLKVIIKSIEDRA